MKHLLFVPAFALLAAMALVGCSDDNGGTDPRIPATSVVVDVTEQELHVGETLQLTATPTPANTTRCSGHRTIRPRRRSPRRDS